MLVKPCSTMRSCRPLQACLRRSASLRRGRHFTCITRSVATVSSPGNTETAPQGPTIPTIFQADLQKGFAQDWSVDFWQRYNAQEYVPKEGEDLQAQLSKYAETAQTALNASGVLNDSQAAAYWTYHLARMTFFLTSGVSSLLANDLRGSVGSGATMETAFNGERRESRLGNALRTGATGPVGEALGMFYQDFKNIQEGKYNLPWDMTTQGHRQLNPLYITRKVRSFVREAVDTLTRRFSANASTDVWFKSPMYPSYYLNTFHYQTDGWLSEHSASVYEFSTETLFLGRQDAMQRQTLVPLSDFMTGRQAADTNILEVACGTGRFATFVKDNYPQAQYTALDLSPFYLEAARDNIKYWKEQRAPTLQLGGYEGTGVRFLQAPAENIPEADGTYDVVVSVYLFHELPADVRKKVASEMARCCKPGGMVIFTDSVQMGDRPVFDANLGRFGDFNEPYYRGYIETDLGELFMEAGLEPFSKLLASSTKVLAFRKPEKPTTPTATPAASTEAPTKESTPAPGPVVTEITSSGVTEITGNGKYTEPVHLPLSCTLTGNGNNLAN